jgi:hypothetical protein
VRATSHQGVCCLSSPPRGFGDRDFKASGLIVAQPDVAAVTLAPHRDAFAVHASDGLWGVLGDQEAVAVAAEVIDKVRPRSAPGRAVCAGRGGARVIGLLRSELQGGLAARALLRVRGG